MGLLGGIFNVIDPILDTISPSHNKVQEWTTGSADRNKQRPYFEKIAPRIVDIFLPGWGSAAAALDSAGKGDWTGAALNSLGSYAQSGQWANTAQEAGQASEALKATDTVSGTPAPSGTTDMTGFTQPTALDKFGATPSSDAGGVDMTGFRTNRADWLLGRGEFGGNAPLETAGGSAISPAGQTITGEGMTVMNGQYPMSTTPELQQNSLYKEMGGSGNGLSPVQRAVAESGARGAPLVDPAKFQQGMKVGGLLMQMNASQQQKKPQAQPIQFAPMADTPRQTQSFQTFNPYNQYRGFNPQPYAKRGLL